MSNLDELKHARAEAERWAHQAGLNLGRLKGAQSALRFARQALESAPQRCLYHGTEFDKLGMQWGEPRCESCQQPWRVVRALKEIELVDRVNTEGGAS